MTDSNEPQAPSQVAPGARGCFNALLIAVEVICVVVAMLFFFIARMREGYPSDDVHWGLTYMSMALAAAGVLEVFRWMFVRKSRP